MNHSSTVAPVSASAPRVSATCVDVQDGGLVSRNFKPADVDTSG